MKLVSFDADVVRGKDDKSALDAALLAFIDNGGGSPKFLYVGFDIRSESERIAVETIRKIVDPKDKGIPVVFSHKNARLKSVEDPYFPEVARFLVSPDVPRVVKDTSYAKVHETILAGIRKFVKNGKHLQLEKPRSLINIRDTLIYDMLRYALIRVYQDPTYRVFLYRKYPVSERAMRVKGLHCPDRIKGVLTRDEYETIVNDDSLRQGWELMSSTSKRILSDAQSGRGENVQARTNESGLEFKKLVGKQFLRIVYSRMKYRNIMIASLKKGDQSKKIGTPKLSMLLSAMLKKNDKFGSPGIAIASLYRADFMSAYDSHINVRIDNNAFVFDWKEEGVNSFSSFREYCRQTANLQELLDGDPSDEEDLE